MRKKIRLHISGIIQGVGFRPFIYKLAKELGLSGYVMNTPAGVEIDIAGDANALNEFKEKIHTEKPPAARVDAISCIFEKPWTQEEEIGFTIRDSRTAGLRRVLITPDMDICAACRAELFIPNDRRYRYPFINCTNCGPRYSLIKNLPYDRSATTMAHFPMCPACKTEYRSPDSRRFHAEIIACPLCGPALTFLDHGGNPLSGEPLAMTAEALASGHILAIKGIGGFHLAVSALDTEAVLLLRQRKGRPAKPLAVMARSIEEVKQFALVPEEEETLLQGREKPIVLLKKNDPFPLSAALAPELDRIGAMLPYSPLHLLLLNESACPVLVMTSGNLSGEPLITTTEMALAKLGRIADFFLVHDRDIVTGIDDSVLQPHAKGAIFLRRSRSFAPAPIVLPADAGHTLALGGAMKNVICLTRGREAFLSQHIGDLDNLATLENFASLIAHMRSLLHIEPTLLVHDLHPDYPSTRYAREQDQAPVVAVQHHHAHAVSCMVEHGLAGPVIAVTLDGAGLGDDSTVWGGEILVATPSFFKRLVHLAGRLMPGGEEAVRRPWRMAASYLHALLGEKTLNSCLPLFKDHGKSLPFLLNMLDKGINCPITSSCGRLFDAIAAILGLCLENSYEGQAAAQLEAAAWRCHDEGGIYPFFMEKTRKRDVIATINPLPVIEALLDEIRKGTDISVCARRVHNTMAAMFTKGCVLVRDTTGLNAVVLSGGVMQNRLFLETFMATLAGEGFLVHAHKKIPPNDGGLCLGQAVAGREIWRNNTAHLIRGDYSK